MSELDDISGVIDAIDEPHFLRVFASALESITSATYLTVFAYERDRAPIYLYDNFDSDQSKEAIRTFLKETYRINPFYIEYCRGISPGIYQLEDLKSPGAENISEFSKESRGKIVVTQDEELGYLTKNWPQKLTEIECVVPVGDGKIIAVTVYRDRMDTTMPEETEEPLVDYFPLLAACIRRFWHRQSERYVANHTLATSSLPSGLTKREVEVSDLVLKGHSSTSIGLVLGVSEMTVKSHRKAVYRKLGISSQAELMSVYVEGIQQSMARKLG